MFGKCEVGFFSKFGVFEAIMFDVREIWVRLNSETGPSVSMLLGFCTKVVFSTSDSHFKKENLG